MLTSGAALCLRALGGRFGRLFDGEAYVVHVSYIIRDAKLEFAFRVRNCRIREETTESGLMPPYESG